MFLSTPAGTRGITTRLRPNAYGMWSQRLGCGNIRNAPPHSRSRKFIYHEIQRECLIYYCWNFFWLGFERNAQLFLSGKLCLEVLEHRKCEILIISSKQGYHTLYSQFIRNSSVTLQVVYSIKYSIKYANYLVNMKNLEKQHFCRIYKGNVCHYPDTGTWNLKKETITLFMMKFIASINPKLKRKNYLSHRDICTLYHLCFCLHKPRFHGNWRMGRADDELRVYLDLDCTEANKLEIPDKTASRIGA